MAPRTPSKKEIRPLGMGDRVNLDVQNPPGEWHEPDNIRVEGEPAVEPVAGEPAVEPVMEEDADGAAEEEEEQEEEEEEVSGTSFSPIMFTDDELNHPSDDEPDNFCLDDPFVIHGLRSLESIRRNEREYMYCFRYLVGSFRFEDVWEMLYSISELERSRDWKWIGNLTNLRQAGRLRHLLGELVQSLRDIREGIQRRTDSVATTEAKVALLVQWEPKLQSDLTLQPLNMQESVQSIITSLNSVIEAVPVQGVHIINIVDEVLSLLDAIEHDEFTYRDDISPPPPNPAHVGELVPVTDSDDEDQEWEHPIGGEVGVHLAINDAEIQPDVAAAQLSPHNTDGEPHATSLSSVSMQLENLPAMMNNIQSDDDSLQLEATTQLRKLLSIEWSPLIEKIIQSGVVPRFVQFLTRENFEQLQLEAAWALANIASGPSDNRKALIMNEAIPAFVKLLGSQNDDVCEQALRALGHLADNSQEDRDLVLEGGALMPLLVFYEDAELSLLRNATWVISNLCRGIQRPSYEINFAISTLARLIRSRDEEVVTHASWALSYLSDGTNDLIQALIEAGVCPRLTHLLLHQSPLVVTAALRTVGNIVTGDDFQTQCIIDHEALPCLLSLLTQNHKKSIKKMACWTISNITAGNKDQIQAVINAGIIGPLLQLLEEADFDIRKEALWAVTNATSGGSHDQIKHLVSQGCIKPLCDLLVCSDSRIVEVCLEGLENIMKVGERDKTLGCSSNVNAFTRLIDEAKGFEKIENLQMHDDKTIYEKAVKLLELYCPKEDAG